LNADHIAAGKKIKKSAACKNSVWAIRIDHTIKKTVAGQQRLVKQQQSKQWAVKQERWALQLLVKLLSNQLLVQLDLIRQPLQQSN
jgi:hypothetical protein